ncbi:MAG TPA: hypothetical protein VHH11_19665 [Gammaproteobacteria bacterium]|jgi:hypothetical protein|nr:hypothetical protein [Gammaproteobacteria bacterium]
MAQKGATAVKDGVQVIQGTPTEPITRPTLFLRLLRVGEGKSARTRASLFMVRPGAAGYVVKELIPDLDLEPQAALEKTIAIAQRGEVGVVYLNADLERIPKRRSAANG